MSHLATIDRQTSKISVILNFKSAKELQDQIGENHWASPTVSLFPQFIEAWSAKRLREIVALVLTFIFVVNLWKQLSGTPPRQCIPCLSSLDLYLALNIYELFFFLKACLYACTSLHITTARSLYQTLFTLTFLLAHLPLTNSIYIYCKPTTDCV